MLIRAMRSRWLKTRVVCRVFALLVIAYMLIVMSSMSMYMQNQVFSTVKLPCFVTRHWLRTPENWWWHLGVTAQIVNVEHLIAYAIPVACYQICVCHTFALFNMIGGYLFSTWVLIGKCCISGATLYDVWPHRKASGVPCIFYLLKNKQ